VTAPVSRGRRIARLLLRIVLGAIALLVLLVAIAAAVSSDVRFVLRGAYEEARILLRRRPLTELAADSTAPAAWREAAVLVFQARAYADSALGLRVGDTYTTFAEVGRDTLVLVLSASPKNALRAHLWRFPIVGTVPYRGFFSLHAAQAAQRKFEAEGYDTYLRSSPAFSTLGWFNDPLLSTVLEGDRVDIAQTVFHEATHTTLYVPNATPFDESFASMVGLRSAEQFFTARGDTAAAARAAAWWRDEVRLSRFYASLADTLTKAYAASLDGAALDRARGEIFGAARAALEGGLDGTLELYSGPGLARRPLNNATVVAGRIYRTRLELFEALYQQAGSVRGAVERLRAAIDAQREADPYVVLERLVGDRTGSR
jgi:predicted aminopeptidase